MATPKLNFAQEIACHSVDPVELALVPAVWTSVRILHEPMGLAVTTKRLLTGLALNGVLQDVVADAANELGQEGLDVLRVVNPVLLVNELLILL